MNNPLEPDLCDHDEIRPPTPEEILEDIRKHAEERSSKDAKERPAVVSDTVASLLERCCRNHPETRASWKCTECGENFCKRCVKPIESLYTGNSGFYARTAACPECKGRCKDLALEADRARHLEEMLRRAKRTLFLRYLLFLMCSVPFLVRLIKWQSDDLAFLLLIIAVWFVPIRSLNIATKLVLVINSCIGLILLGLASQVDGIRGTAAFSFSYTPVKYLFIIGVTYILLYVTGKTSDLAGSIYTGPSARNMNFGRINKMLLIGSLLIIIAVFILGSYHYIANYLLINK